MEFPDSYFEDEVREGFYVPGLMKRAWAAQLEVLEAVNKVCEKHNIDYFAEWGTLLGAVRHGGMIPWDDDIDICMKRKDYERFLMVAEEELPEGYKVFSYRNLNTDNIVSKIVSYPVYLIRNEDLPRFHGYPYVTLIDLFVMDFLPSDKKAEDEFLDFVQLVAELMDSVDKHDMKPETIEYALGIVEKACGFPIDREKSVKRQLMQAEDTVAARFQEEYSNEITILAYLLRALSSDTDQNRYRYRKSWYAQTVKIPFEKMDISVPAGYGKLLEKKYKNYMKPYREFTTHEYPSYKTVNQLVNKLYKGKTEFSFFQYRFSQQEMETIEKGRIRRDTFQKQVQDFLPLFQEAHQEIRQRMSEGDLGTAMQILGECQNVAIQLGTMIEERCGEGHATVRVLEQYCENVFHLHEALNNGGTDETGMLTDTLTAMEDRLADSIQSDIREKKEVVFVPYKTAYWGAMESVWQAAAADEDTEVYVIPAPYYYKDDFGRAKKKEPHYETAYPAYVPITSYDEYNFETHHPTQIVIQCPYDEYNYGLTIHPFFYAKNLKKYTDQLVFIPPFVMDEILPGDGRGRVTLRYLCNTPGVVHADQVIVQSEMMKEVYVELLTEFAGEETRELWETKILGSGSPVWDQAEPEPDSADIPEEWRTKIWRPDGSRKKIILYATNVSVLYNYGEPAVDKMRDVLRQFHENLDEVVLWWRPDPRVREVLRKTKPGALQKYRDLLQEYRETGWGICDESQDATRAVLACDAYYGDAGSAANMCRVQKKPVLFQEVEHVNQAIPDRDLN